MIGIYGCGWLGEDLATHFIEKKIEIIGSTTTKEKKQKLLEKKIPSLILKIENELECEDPALLQKPDVFIINIPPRMKDKAQGYHLKQIQMLSVRLLSGNQKKLLFISSTSVYGDNQGFVDENTTEEPDSQSGKELLSVEKYLMNTFKNRISILRFGGLIDESRQPGRFLSGKVNLENGDAPVNLIHKKDCIGIIDRIIHLEKWGEVFNGVSDERRTRREFYTQYCEKKNIPIPVFKNEKNLKNYKTVSNQKVKKVLNYSFQVSIM